MIENATFVHLFYPLLFLVILVIAIILIFVIARCFKDKLDNKKDIHAKDKDTEIVTEIVNKILEYRNKYPDVSLDFILKSNSEKAIDNNQELQSFNNKFEAFETRFDRLEYFIQQLNITQSMANSNKN